MHRRLFFGFSEDDHMMIVSTCKESFSDLHLESVTAASGLKGTTVHKTITPVTEGDKTIKPCSLAIIRRKADDQSIHIKINSIASEQKH